VQTIGASQVLQILFRKWEKLGKSVGRRIPILQTLTLQPSAKNVSSKLPLSLEKHRKFTEKRTKPGETVISTLQVVYSPSS
jgi:hypothetical protein